jgi:hypothetical protein
VRDSVTEYAKKRDEIQKTIIYYEDLIKKIKELIIYEALREDIELVTPSEDNFDYTEYNSGPSSNEKKLESLNKVNKNLEAAEIVAKVHSGTIVNDGSGWIKDAKAQGYSDEAI